MPWTGAQKIAIFLDKKRKAGEAAAKRYMAEHGSPMGKRKRRKRKKVRSSS